ncbi:MAG: histidine kinase [Cytophagales bacterium]|nr:histidine kinase [Cytophagales bacterium]
MEESQASEFVSILVSFSLIVFIIAVGVVLLTWQFRKNLHQQQLEQEALKLAHQKHLLQTSIEVQEEERKRIARDLHDELGAALSMGRMWLTQLETQEKVDTNKVGEVRELVENALNTSRRISHELVPLQLSGLGLERALRSVLDRAGEVGELQASLEMKLPDKLNKNIELGLYRVFTELINNTLKHASASEIHISTVLVDNRLVCKYEDNGKGLPENHNKNGLGLKSLEGRVSALEGEWYHGNRESGGFFATIDLPLA